MASMSLDRPMGFTDRLAMRGHELSCHVCRGLRRRLREIDDAARSLTAGGREDPRRLSDAARRRVVARIKAEAVDGGDPTHP